MRRGVFLAAQATACTANAACSPPSVDLKRRRIFDIAPGQSEVQLRDFLASLLGREQVAVVCIDLNSAYRTLVPRYFLNARMVVDRFHVVRIIYQHFISLARAIAPELQNHRGHLLCLRKRPEKLTTVQRGRLKRLLQRHPALRPLYKKMHQLRTLKHWAEPIACMWRFSRNNAITEGFHRIPRPRPTRPGLAARATGPMKLIQRRAYGFRSFHNYRLRVIAQCG